MKEVSHTFQRLGTEARALHIDERHRMRILAFCHDSFGLGHFRRTTNLARALVALEPRASVLCMTASPRPEIFGLPQGVGFVRLPGVTKDADGGYVSRKLNITTDRLLSLRAELIRTTAREYEPDLIIVDHAAVGVRGELIPMLEDQRARSPRVRMVLGMRDILDEPRRARAELSRPEVRFAIEEWYDQVVVFGHPQVCDLAEEYGLSARVRRKLRYVGIACSVEAPRSAQTISGPKLVVTVGGGEDGHAVLDAVADWLLEDPDAAEGATLVTGPLIGATAHGDLSTRLQDTGATVIESTPDLPDLLQSAESVLAMGGYNTVYETLSLQKRLVVVPRVRPRMEQWERAHRLEGMGLLDVVEPSELGRPGVLPRALDRARLRRTVDPAGCGLRFDGASVAARTLLADVSA